MRTALRVAFFALALLVAFSLGFSWRDVRMGSPPSVDAFARLLTFRLDDGQTPTQLFSTHYNKILARYHEPIDPTDLKYAAMSGLFASLGDPHTQFLNRRAAEEFAIETRGNYVGIGARLGDDPLGARVYAVFKNGPAERAGLKVEDVVTAVDGMDVGGMDTDEIVQYVRGRADTTVTLTVSRASEPNPVTIVATRANVIVPTAEGKMLEGTNVGYIAVAQFSETTVEQFDAALQELHRQRPDGLVIDMRNNPGGLLETAVAMLGRFVDNKAVVSMRQKRNRREVAWTKRGQTLGISYPVIVLINENSASAAEIFAGVLRDYGRASLLGQHSYGKASVQSVILLRDFSEAKITVGRYYLPNGENISRKVDEDGLYVSGGLKPQYEVPLQLDEDGLWEQGNPERDNQLAEAIRIIQQKRGG